MIPFSKRTNESIFLEYMIAFTTVEDMALNYGRTIEEMKTIICKGRDEHHKI